MQFYDVLARIHTKLGVYIIQPDTNVPNAAAAALVPLWPVNPKAAREASAQARAVGLMSTMQDSLHWTWVTDETP